MTGMIGKCGAGLRMGILCLVVLMAGTAMPQAQQGPQVWVQVESTPTLTGVMERLRDYAARLPDVQGFQTSTGWYVVVLGPYSGADAARLRRDYLSRRAIPRDAYLSDGTGYLKQIWPAGMMHPSAPSVPQAPPPADSPVDRAETANPPAPDTSETVAQSRRAERALDAADRARLQTALAWAGVYGGPIDAAFGPGTRAAMAAWQRGRAYPETGVLSSEQRQELLADYDAVLADLDMAPVRDEQAGIEIRMPRALVAFEAYSFPFAHYKARTGLGAQVLLISEDGDRETLTGLYGLMQTLAAVPGTGARALARDGFTITGEDGRIVSQTQVWLREGKIKGFMLIWPAGDEARRTRVIREMADSFQAFGPALQDRVGPVSGGGPGLTLGLDPAPPRLSRSGFYVDGAGRVLTSAEIAGCGRITVDGVPADLAAQDAGTGLALLVPRSALAPAAVAQVAATVRRNEPVAVAGYSWGGVLGAPSVSFGTVAGLTGLQDEPGMIRLAVGLNPSDTGGPVLNDRGQVVGMVRTNPHPERQLPDAVAFAVDRETVAAFLSGAGVPAGTEQATALPPEALTRVGRGMAVLVECRD